jgi:glycerophosphoryl diester phosphodiesterase
MFIIGHRGSAGTHPENTLDALREAIDAGADMVEFDVRLTRDGHVVLAHDYNLIRTHRRNDTIAGNSLAQLRKLSAHTQYPTVTLEQALDLCYGRILVNIELKRRSTVAPALAIVERYIQDETDWEMVLFSSFWPSMLAAMRQRAPRAQLSLLQHVNSFTFVKYHRQLNLTSVGFHRLHINRLAIEIARQLEIFTYAYTVNRPEAAERLAQRGIEGVVTDYPRKLQESQDGA